MMFTCMKETTDVLTRTFNTVTSLRRSRHQEVAPWVAPMSEVYGSTCLRTHVREPFVDCRSVL